MTTDDVSHQIRLSITVQESEPASVSPGSWREIFSSGILFQDKKYFCRPGSLLTIMNLDHCDIDTLSSQTALISHWLTLTHTGLSLVSLLVSRGEVLTGAE